MTEINAMNLFKEILKISQKLKKCISNFYLSDGYIYSDSYDFGKVYGRFIIGEKSEYFKFMKLLGKVSIKINTSNIYKFSKIVKGKDLNVKFLDNRIEFTSPQLVEKFTLKFKEIEFKKKFNELCKPFEEEVILSDSEKMYFKNFKENSINIFEILKIDKYLRINEKMFPSINKNTIISLKGDSVFNFVEKGINLLFDLKIIRMN